MSKLWTIGYGGVAWPAFAETLTSAQIQLVVDIREVPQSKSQRCYNGEELAHGLQHLGILYMHERAFGNPFRGKEDGLLRFREHMADPYRLDRCRKLAEATRSQRIALLCGCVDPAKCHRSIVAQFVGVDVAHLHPPLGGVVREPLKIYGLTVLQPWAWAICEAGKRVENRTWKPEIPIGTYLAIHAGKKMDEEGIVPGLRAVPKNLPMGAIVAVARYQGLVMEDDENEWFCGPYGWQLDDVRAIEPVPCRGFQRLWKIPDDVLAVVRERWRK